MLKITTLVAATLLIAGCKTLPTAENAAKLNVQVSWTQKSACSRVSPPITIQNLPTNAKFLEIRMVDLDLPTFNHGGGEVAITGNTVAEGALKYFNGPCPPTPHRYEFTVKALDSNKALIVGVGTTIKRYPQ